MEFLEKKLGLHSLWLAHIDLTGSTNTDLLNWVKTTSFQEPHVLWADRQTAGRGTRGRKWQMPQNALLFSVAIPLRKTLQKYIGVTLTVGMKITHFLRSHGIDAALKWPNDIVVNDRKLAGILIENSKNDSDINTLVIGVGLNLALDDSKFEHFRACSVSDFVDISWNVEKKTQWVEDLSICVIDAVREVEEQGLKKTVSDWESVAAFQGESVDLFQDDELVCSGILHGIDESGRLLVLTPDGIRVFMSGTISLRKK